MSLFQEDTSQIETAIDYFNSLSSQQKALIVSDLSYVPTNQDLLNRLSPILGAIQNDISKYDETTMAQKLFELGMEETYAKLLVNSMIKQAPTVQYEISVLAKLSDEDFKEKVPALMNSMWVKQLTSDELISQYDLSAQFIQSFMNFSRTFMNGLQRRQHTEDHLKNLCLENGLSSSSTDVLLNTFHVNTKFWYDMLVFTNTQDSVFELKAIRQENSEILKTLKDLLKILKEGKDPSDPRHFQ